MSAYITLLYFMMLATAGLVYAVCYEVSVNYLQPLVLQFEHDPGTVSWLNNFISALLPVAIVITSSWWYITQMQRRKVLEGF